MMRWTPLKRLRVCVYFLLYNFYILTSYTEYGIQILIQYQADGSLPDGIWRSY